jgi:hypothetical protein
MAAMDMRRARAIAEQKIKSGQNKGLGLEDLVQQIIAESAGAGAPGTAIGAALAPVTLTPAATAPMQPGVPLRAPKPTTEMLPQPQEQELPVAEAPQRAARPSRYQPELDRVMANIAVAEQAMAGQQPNVTDQIRIGELKRQAEVLGALVRAEQSPEAEIPEEMRAAMEGRQARITRREELLGEQQARAPFAALLAAGAAGTQGRRGETDVEAITRILQAGFGGYDQSRRGFEEGTENIAEARDQAMIDRYNMQEKAREAARQRALEIMGIGEKAEDRAVRDVRLPMQIRGEEAGTALAEFKAKDAPAEAASERALRAAQAAYYRDRPDRAGSKVDVEGRQNRDELDKANADYEAARAEYNLAIRDINKSKNAGDLTPEEKINQIDSEVKTKFLQAEARLKALSRAYERTGQKSPYFSGQSQGAAPTRTATAAPTGGAGWSATKF